MPIRDHQTRVAKLRVRVTLVDPSQRIIEVADKTGSPRRLTVFEVPVGWTWPVVGEEWSIYEENGTWVLGNKFLSPEEAKAFESQEPGDSFSLGSGLGYYSATGVGTGTIISIPQSIHRLRSSRGIIVQVQIESTGEVISASSGITTVAALISVSSTGDVTVTFATSQTLSNYRITLLG